MENKKNLFIVNSLLQVINTFEAINYFNLQNIVFVVIYNRSENNINQIKNQIDNLEIDELIEVNVSKKANFFKYVKLIKELKKYQYDKVFTGEIDDSKFRITIANLKKEKLYLLDEGLSTTIAYETRLKLNKINKYRFKDFRFLLLGLKIKLKDTVNFFTYYDFAPLKGGEVIKNNLEYMKKDFKQSSVDYSNTLFFLGQPLFIFSDKNDFNITLKKIIEKYKDKKIVYIPHREENLQEVINSINENIEILNINQPIEKYFLNNGIYPKHIVSYSSTALITTKILFKECFIEYINIQNSTINYLDIIYTYFEKNNILKFK